MRTVQYVYPGGHSRALTFSYDDGVIQDRRLVEIFDASGLRCTFNLNAGKLDAPGHLTARELPELFKNHEIASHTYTHPFPSQQPNESNLEQIISDRRALEAAAGRPVRGFAYPFGDGGNGYDALLKAAGIDYARTVSTDPHFSWPDDFYFWKPTCHHNDRLSERWGAFLAPRSWGRLSLFYVWGHSYEFDNDNNWDMFEAFCRRAGGNNNCWFAANNDIMDYILALRRLRWSVDGCSVINPSALSVYVLDENDLRELGPGLTIMR